MCTRLLYPKPNLIPKFHRSIAYNPFLAPSARSISLVAQSRHLRIAKEIEDAIAHNKPVVALESAIYTHGYPKPENAKLALHLDQLVRENGGIPASIGILDGLAIVGLKQEELVRLASLAGSSNVRKVSRRDLSYVCGHQLNGGTTISATMLLSHLAGIQIFATGGLGGVHKGGETTLDISADLTELGRTPVSVVCSGCKGFLDIHKTLEYLETQGAAVMTFADGRTGAVEFPAFWTRDSGVVSPMTVQSEIEAAAVAFSQSELGIQSGLLMANPIPAAHSIEKPKIKSIIKLAVKAAKNAHLPGNEHTPFILSKIRDLTAGKSIEANSALVEANVIRATKVAIELCKLREEAGKQSLSTKSPTSTRRPLITSGTPSTTAYIPQMIKETQIIRNQVTVAGSVAIDTSCDYVGNPANSLQQSPKNGTSNPAEIRQSIGGVGYNLALALKRTGANVKFQSLVSRDDPSSYPIISELERHGLHENVVQVVESQHRTARYVAVNNSSRDLVLAMADMDIFQCQAEKLNSQGLPHGLVLDHDKGHGQWLVVDANWDSQTMHNWIEQGKKDGSMVVFEPVSTRKARRLFTAKHQTGKAKHLPTYPNHIIDITTPNESELEALASAARGTEYSERDDWYSVISSFNLPASGSRDRLVAMTSQSIVDRGIPQQSIQLLPVMPCIITTLGTEGVLLAQIIPSGDSRLQDPDYEPFLLSRSSPDNEQEVGGIFLRHFPPRRMLEGSDVKSVNGAGDTFLGVLVSALSQSSETGVVHVEDCIEVAQEASVLTLQSLDAVAPEISTLTEEVRNAGKRVVR